jgi:hypothetical protein
MSAPMVSQLIRLRRGPSWRNAKMRVRDPPSHGSTPTPAWPVTAMWRSSGKIIKGGCREPSTSYIGSVGGQLCFCSKSPIRNGSTRPIDASRKISSTWRIRANLVKPIDYQHLSCVLHCRLTFINVLGNWKYNLNGRPFAFAGACSLKFSSTACYEGICDP